MGKKSVVRLTDRPDMTLDVYRGRKTTIQQQQQQNDAPALEAYPAPSHHPTTPSEVVGKGGGGESINLKRDLAKRNDH